MILLCGGTGLLGGMIARELAARDVGLRALVRNGSDAGALERLGAEVVRGDFRDPASLERAADGAQTVVSGVTAILRMLEGREGRKGLREVDAQGHLALVDAAERAGAERFVFVSAGGMERIPHVPLARAKLAVEARLRESPLREVIVAPDAFQDVWLTPIVQLDWPNGKLTLFGRGDSKARYVSAEDVAAAIASWTVADDPPRRVEIGGPEGLTRNEVADLIEDAAGRPLKRRRVPHAVLAVGSRALAGVKPEVATLMGLSLLFDSGDVQWDDAPLWELGIEPRSPRDFIRQAVAASTSQDS
jgi:uncharacterized protein YbjT (DUF2867 family)